MIIITTKNVDVLWECELILHNVAALVTVPAAAPLNNNNAEKTAALTDRHTDAGLESMDDRPRHLRVRTGPGGCWSASASGRRRAASSNAPPWRESPGERRAFRAWRALPSRSQTWNTATQADSNTLKWQPYASYLLCRRRCPWRNINEMKNSQITRGARVNDMRHIQRETEAASEIIFINQWVP